MNDSTGMLNIFIALIVSPPPNIEVHSCFARHFAIALDPSWNGFFSNMPTGPFHITVLDSVMMLQNFSADHFPRSKAFISPTKSSTGVSAVSASSEASEAATRSCGRMILV